MARWAGPEGWVTNHNGFGSKYVILVLVFFFERLVLVFLSILF